MPGFDIKVSGIDQAFAGLDKRTIAKGTARGLNKMAAQAKTHVKEAIRREYTLKASEIAAKIQVSRATPSYLVATIFATGKRLSLLKYQVSKTLKGVTYRIKKGKRTLLRGYFEATVQTGHAGVGHTGIFHRTKPAVSRIGKGHAAHGLHIAEFTGPSLPQLMGSHDTMASVKVFVTANLNALVAHEIMFEIERTKQ